MTKTLLEWVSLDKNKDSVKRAVASDCTFETCKKRRVVAFSHFFKFSSESKFRNSLSKVNVKKAEQVVFRKSCRQQRCMKVLKYLSQIFFDTVFRSSTYRLRQIDFTGHEINMYTASTTQFITNTTEIV